MKRLFTTAALSLLFSATAVAADPAPDAVSRMFTWWNGAFKRADGFTAESFTRYFTPDATLTIDGKMVVHGIPEWVSHFRRIQASGMEVEIVVPFKDAFAAGNRVYTYHVIRSRKAGKVYCMLAAGDARLHQGRIASISLVRKELDEAGIRAEPACWQPG